jgi:hypothetical protein
MPKVIQNLVSEYLIPFRWYSITREQLFQQTSYNKRCSSFFWTGLLQYSTETNISVYSGDGQFFDWLAPNLENASVRDWFLFSWNSEASFSKVIVVGRKKANGSEASFARFDPETVLEVCAFLNERLETRQF